MWKEPVVSLLIYLLSIERKKLCIESKTMLVHEDLIRKEKDNNFFEGELKLEDQVGR